MEDTFSRQTIPSTRFTDDYLVLLMSMTCAAVAFLGFAPTYWVPLIEGRLTAAPIIHLHGAVFFTWSVFLVYQTWLAASGRLRSHRRTGMIGVSLATAMVAIGLATAISRMHWAERLGQGEAGKAFAIVPVSTVLFFGIVFATAIVLVRQRDWHKRLMLVAAISILDAPIARWFIVLLAPAAPAGPPPVAVDLGPSLVAALLLVGSMLADYRISRRLHPAYVLGLLGYAAVKIGQVPASETAAWKGIATWLMKFGV
ncbi:MAG: hypothetical protein R3D44_06365 [Hyphomicrobiaceae bacterium]